MFCPSACLSPSPFPAKNHPYTGFVTSGLELWQGEPCAQSYFRQRLWGTLSMAQTLLSDRMCWMRHMKLDPVTGVTALWSRLGFMPLGFVMVLNIVGDGCC